MFPLDDFPALLVSDRLNGRRKTDGRANVVYPGPEIRNYLHLWSVTQMGLEEADPVSCDELWLSVR